MKKTVFGLLHFTIVKCTSRMPDASKMHKKWVLGSSLMAPSHPASQPAAKMGPKWIPAKPKWVQILELILLQNRNISWDILQKSTTRRHCRFFFVFMKKSSKLSSRLHETPEMRLSPSAKNVKKCIAKRSKSSSRLHESSILRMLKVFKKL